MPNRSLRSHVLLLAALLGVAGCRSAPPYQGLTADEIHALAQREFDEGDYEDARQALNRLLLTFAQYDRAAEARFLLARAHFEDEEYISAASEWTRFLDRYPTHAAAPEAALGICRANAALSPDPQRDQTYTEQALTICRNVVQDYPGDPVALQAAEIANDMRGKLARKLYEVGDYYFSRDLFDSAILYFQMVDEQYGDTEWAPRAVLATMRAYEEIGYEDLAQEARDRLLNVYGESPEARTVAAEAAAASTAADTTGTGEATGR